MKTKQEIAQSFLEYLAERDEVNSLRERTEKEIEVEMMALEQIRRSLLPDAPKQKPWYKFW